MKKSTLGMEACKFVRTRMGKIAWRKFSEIFKKRYLVESIPENSNDGVQF